MLSIGAGRSFPLHTGWRQCTEKRHQQPQVQPTPCYTLCCNAGNPPHRHATPCTTSTAFATPITSPQVVAASALQDPYALCNQRYRRTFVIFSLFYLRGRETGQKKKPITLVLCIRFRACKIAGAHLEDLVSGVGVSGTGGALSQQRQQAPCDEALPSWGFP